MICANCRIEGAVQIGSGCVLQPLCTVLSTTAAGITIGEKNNIEEMCSIVDSNIGHGNLIQVGTAIEKSEIGSFTTIGAKCTIKDGSIIGSRCFVSPGVTLRGVTIPDGSSVFRLNDTWTTRPVDVSTIFPVNEAYREALLNPESKICLKNHHSLKS